MNGQPEVSVITVNYNGLKDTCELIESLRKYVTVSYELIVIDNASAVNECDYLKNHYPEVIGIRSDRNLGFSGGNNLGIKASRGKFLLLLNNDTLVGDDSFHYLIEKLESDPRIGAVSPKIKFAFSPENIQFAGFTPFSHITLRNRSIGCGEKDLGQYDISVSTPYLHGAAMMIKRGVIQNIGMMPEIYFLYYEELDWCTQMRRAGYLLYYEPRCTVFHKESQSTGKTSPLRTFYMTRNRLLFAFRNLKGASKYLSLAYQMSVAPVKNSLNFLMNGRPDLIKATFSGIYNFIILKNKK